VKFVVEHLRRATRLLAVSPLFVAVLAGLLAGLLALCSGMTGAGAQEKHAGPLVLDLQINGEIEPVLATYVEEGLADAARRQASLVLITMDTPGGLSDSTQKIVQHILDSPVPVAVYKLPPVPVYA